MQIKAISIYLPENIISNESLSKQFNITADEIYKKTGVIERRHTSIDFIMEDMAYTSAKKLLEQYPEYSSQINGLIVVGHGFSYKAPNTSAILQHRLNLPTNCYCIDLPYGCAGYVYGLSISKMLIEQQIAQNVLLITGDTPSYVIRKDDVELMSIFGDSATSTLITSYPSRYERFVFKTDGKGYDKLIVEHSGTRHPAGADYFLQHLPLYGTMKMDGTAIFLMSIKEVPDLIQQCLIKNEISMNDINYFVCHQANSFMLEMLRKKLNIPREKFFNDIRYTGNTVSSSIPIALHQLIKENKIQRGMKILLAGFGIGYSLAATVIEF